MVQHDVNKEREELNFSEWDRKQSEADEAAEEVEEGEMPMWIFTLTHPEARLSADETSKLVAGLNATMPEHEEVD